MSLPSPAPRKLLHTRVIVCEGYERADEQWDVDALLTDKTIDAPLHETRLRFTVDAKLTITESQTDVPANGAALTGLTLKSGFTRKVDELIESPALRTLIGPAATTMLQTMVRARVKRAQEARDKGLPRSMPHFLNTCHSWATNSPVVKREYPEFYKGE